MSRPSADVGTELLYADDRLRVWDLRLEPGESSGVHRHECDYVIIYVTPDNELESVYSDRPPVRARYGDGFVAHTVVGRAPDGSMTHELRNVGSRPHRHIVIELLGESASETTRAPTDNGRKAPIP